jgi:hypothetical protein
MSSFDRRQSGNVHVIVFSPYRAAFARRIEYVRCGPGGASGVATDGRQDSGVHDVNGAGV